MGGYIVSEYRDLSAGLAARMALNKYEFHFSHSLGQNFILDDGLVESIIAAAQVEEGQNVLEIGPGAGVMTRLLSDAGAQVTAIELDKTLEPVLSDVLYGRENVRVIFGDAMKLDIGEVMGDKPYRVIANLPYYITADVILRMLTQSAKPQRITVMVQKEAAERMMAKMGSKIWCALAATVQYFAKVEVLMEVPPEAFTPRPHVDSALIELTLHEEKPVSAQNEGMMLKVINTCFAMRRKTLLNNLSAGFSIPREVGQQWLKAAGLDEKVRGEALTLEEIARLSDVITESR